MFPKHKRHKWRGMWCCWGILWCWTWTWNDTGSAVKPVQSTEPDGAVLWSNQWRLVRPESTCFFRLGYVIVPSSALVFGVVICTSGPMQSSLDQCSNNNFILSWINFKKDLSLFSLHPSAGQFCLAKHIKILDRHYFANNFCFIFLVGGVHWVFFHVINLLWLKKG